MSLRHYCRIMFSACYLVALLFLLNTPILSLETPSHALALSSDNSITITSQSTSVNFPNLINFGVSARDSNSNIVSAEIVIDLQNNNGPETHEIPLTAPLHSVKLNWSESTTGNNFVPPGATITYFWRFADSAGTVYLEPQQALTTTDTRFSWQHLDSGLLQVDWYGRPLSFGQVLLNKASQALDSISANLGGGLRSQVNLWAYDNDTDFHGSLPPGSYEWVGGIAFPTLKEAEIVVTDGNDLTLIRDMPHELTHLVFHQLIGLQNGAPTWFDEGLAVDNQQYHEADMKARLDQALATHSLLRLSSISFGFPADSDQAYLAYAQSWNLVQYMYDTLGKARMIQFIKNIGSSAYDFNAAMQAALGVDTLHLENQWRLHLNQPGIPLPPTEITPTPQATPQATRQATGASSTGKASSDDRSWSLILLGVVLVIASFAGLMALLVTLSRGRKTAIATPATGMTAITGTPGTPPRGNNGAPAPTFDPSLYMKDSIYMRPAEASPQPARPSPSQQPPAIPAAQPAQPMQPVWPPRAGEQEYSGYRPISPRPPAPQE